MTRKKRVFTGPVLIVVLHAPDPVDPCGVTHSSAHTRAACEACAEILANLAAVYARHPSPAERA